MFDDLLTCQWLCEEEPRYKTRKFNLLNHSIPWLGACLEPFDEHYRDECNGGMWRQNYYFDKHKMVTHLEVYMHEFKDFSDVLRFGKKI